MGLCIDRCISVLLLLCLCVQLLFLKKTDADFHLGFSLRLFESHPSNRLADGSCCEPTCTSCNTILNFCFRDSQHPLQDTNLDTCFLMNERDTTSLFIFLASNTPPLSLNLTVSFTIYRTRENYIRSTIIQIGISSTLCQCDPCE